MSAQPQSVRSPHDTLRAQQQAMVICIDMLKAIEQLARYEPEATAKWLYEAFENAPVSTAILNR